MSNHLPPSLSLNSFQSSLISHTSTLELNSPHTDGITQLMFHGSEPSFLVTSSWDQSINLYDTRANQLVTHWTTTSPVMNVQWDPRAFQCFAVTLDGQVGVLDLNAGQWNKMGTHPSGLRAMTYVGSEHTLYTGGWDTHLRIWDPRCAKQVDIFSPNAGRILDVDASPSSMYLAMATHEPYTLIYDRRYINDQPLEQRQHPHGESSMTRRLKWMPHGNHGYVRTAVDGRISIDYVSDDHENPKSFSFKCHRVQRPDAEYVYPVNCVDFHPIHSSTFASGGGDGVVNVWNTIHKKRLRSFPAYSTSIASLSFSCDGRQLAMAVSYTYEEGEKEHPPDSIYIRSLQETDVKPKHLKK